jgi:hypothetical protein
MTKGKGIWDAVKGSLVETVPDVTHGGAGQSAVGVSVIGGGITAVATPGGGAAGGSSGGSWGSTNFPPTVDSAAVTKIETRLQSAAPAIYVAFTEQADALKDVIPDETTRLRAAMKTSHATPEQIGGAIDGLLVVAGAVLTEFNQSFEAKRTASTSAATEQIETGKLQVATLESQLKELQERIATYHTQIVASEAKLAADAARFETVKQGFQAAHAQVVARLNADKQRITMQTRIG